jgi:putative ABC transport system substrate-binding protein
MPVIGFLGSASPEPYAPMVAAFRQGLKEKGYVEGQTVAIEYRWANAQYDRVPAMAAELASRQVGGNAANGTSSTLLTLHDRRLTRPGGLVPSQRPRRFNR